MITSVAPVMLLMLSIYMLGIAPSKPSVMSELGVLETLWLEAQSEVLHEYLLRVEDPTVYNLRVGGMFDVCLADEVHDVLEKRRDAVHDG